MAISELSSRRPPSIPQVTGDPTAIELAQRVKSVWYVSPEMRGVANAGGLGAVAWDMQVAFLKLVEEGLWSGTAQIILPEYGFLKAMEEKGAIPKRKLVAKLSEEHGSDPGGRFHGTEIFHRKIGEVNKEIDGVNKKTGGVDCFFIGAPEFEGFGPKDIYKAGGAEGEVYRYSRFLERSCQYLKTIINRPDTEGLIVNFNDWTGALGPELLQTICPRAHAAAKFAIVFHLHNIFSRTFCSPDSLWRLHRDTSLPNRGDNDSRNVIHEAFRRADAIIAVSPGFAKETQASEVIGADGLFERAREAVAQGIYYGVQNGANADWAPETHKQLQIWAEYMKSIKATGDLDTPIELRLDPASTPDVMNFDENIEPAQMEAIFKTARKSLCRYLNDHHGTQFTPDRPIFVIVSRYDGGQKGIEHYKIAVQKILERGGQVLIMGTEPDEVAMGHLRELERWLREDYSPATYRYTPVYDENKSVKWENGSWKTESWAVDRACVILDGDHFEKGLHRQGGHKKFEEEGYKLLFGERFTDVVREGRKEVEVLPLGAIARLAANAGVALSRYEPCGLTPLEFAFFAVLSVVIGTGGLTHQVKGDSIELDGLTFAQRGYIISRIYDWAEKYVKDQPEQAWNGKTQKDEIEKTLDSACEWEWIKTNVLYGKEDTSPLAQELQYTRDEILREKINLIADARAALWNNGKVDSPIMQTLIVYGQALAHAEATRGRFCLENRMELGEVPDPSEI